MKTVVAAGFVVEHERRWLFLPRAMAAVEKFPMVQWKWLFGRAQFGRPAFRGRVRAIYPNCCVKSCVGQRAPSSSVELGDVLAHLVLPVGPVVAALRAPVVERMANVLLRENAGKMIRGAGIFPLASTSG